tara:strand:+ start:194 stop:1162 length:969 start_codon:yes stop_codon:yes gene_type:complete
MNNKDLEKFVDIIYPNKTSLDEASVSGGSFTSDLSDLGISYKATFNKTNFHIDEEKSVLDALNTGERTASKLSDIFNTPVKSLSQGKLKVYKVFIDLYTSIGVWDSSKNNFYPDSELDPNDLKIKNNINGLTLVKSLLYLAEIGEVDERFKGWWRKFLNKYVEKLDVIVNFSIQETDLSQKGLYLWVFDNEIKYVGIASEDYARTLKNEYGGIKGYQCTLNGNETRCKLNGKVQEALNQGKSVDYYICPISPSELKQIYNKNQDVLDNYLPDTKDRFDQKSLTIIESCLIYKLNTLKPSGINGNYSNRQVGNDLKNNGTLNK